MTTPIGSPEPTAGFARALINSSPLPLVLLDGDLRVVFATRSFCSAFGLTDLGTDGQLLAEVGEGEWAIPQLGVLLENARVGGPDMGDYETDLKRVGADPRRLVLNVRNIVHDDLDNPRILLSADDVTELRRAERLNAALLVDKDNLLRERSVLLQEMQHRVANSLQIIASVLLLKARTVKSEETRESLRDAHDRVMSVAAVQRHLEFALGDVEVGPYLTKLCDSLASSMIRESRPLTLTARADVAIVSSQEAVSLGLIVTELVINALKHAFPEGQGGEVEVSYAVQPAGWTLAVTDNGVGRPRADADTRIGLGTSVVEALARRLGARVEISDAGPGARVAVVMTPGPLLS